MKQHQNRLSHVPAIILAIVYVFLGIFSFYRYFEVSTNFLLGLCIAPYLFTVQKGAYSARNFVPAVLAIILAIMIPVKTTLFLATLFALLFLVENNLGRINNTFFFLLMVVSPLFTYVSSAAGFPIRLWLTEVSAVILAATGEKANAAGNLIRMKDGDFSVDQACAGLNMLSVSLIICLFLIAFYQRRQATLFSFYEVTAMLAVTVVLNLACNLFRIITLVLFRSPPETAGHELIGLLCLAAYVIIPVTYVVRRYSSYKMRRPQGMSVSKAARSEFLQPRYFVAHVLMSCCLLYCVTHLENHNIADAKIGSSGVWTTYKKEVLASKVVKLTRPNALVYLKATPFYGPEHNPMVCWRGSGYEFSFISKERIGGVLIYTGTLTRGKNRIYSAWWFDNGSLKTVNQLKWRWRAATDGSQFSLVNVNAPDKKALNRLAAEVIRGYKNVQAARLTNLPPPTFLSCRPESYCRTSLLIRQAAGNIYPGKPR